MIHTKIICTIGPSVNSLEMLTSLIQAGMNVARLNFSHGTHEEHQKVIEMIKQVRSTLNVPVAIMLDTKGPEIRLGKIKDGGITVAAKSRLMLVKETLLGDENRVSLRPEFILDHLEPGMSILFDDGYISSIVIEVSEKGVVVELLNGGVIRSGKGVNIPNSSFDLPAVTERDIADIRFGCSQGIDMIAASFVRSVEHVHEIKQLLSEEGRSDILVLAKIENSEGVQNFDAIVQVADGIMIARGDLGVEVPLSHVPRLQKMMIRKCCLAGKPAVTATQMLESMIHNPRPTRAEVSDVANAIYDGSSAVMLSGETAMGEYPLETVHMMRGIIAETEQDINYRDFFALHSEFIFRDTPSALTVAAVQTGYSANAKAIFAFTNSGETARLISRLRPAMPIIAMTPNERSYYQMAINWGVIPVLREPCRSVVDALRTISEFAMHEQIVNHGDQVVVTAGVPFGISGSTNMMLVETIGAGKFSSIDQ